MHKKETKAQATNKARRFTKSMNEDTRRIISHKSQKKSVMKKRKK